jgi:hypothetical protein
VHPVRQHLAPAALGEAGRAFDKHAPDDLVAGQPGVAVDEALVRCRRDHERRVGHHQVEPVAGHRLEQVTDPQVDRDVIERGRQPGQRDAACAQVGRHHFARVPAEVERLHTRPGPEVECSTSGLADGELGQAGGRRRDPEHVVRAHPPVPAVESRSQVGDDPPGPVVVGVRPHVDQRAHLVSGALDQTALDQRFDEAWQRAFEHHRRNRRLKRPQPDKRCERGTVCRTPQARDCRVASERGVRLRPQQTGDAVDRELGLGQRLTQPCQRSRRERG